MTFFTSQQNTNLPMFSSTRQFREFFYSWWRDEIINDSSFNSLIYSVEWPININFLFLLYVVLRRMPEQRFSNSEKPQYFEIIKKLILIIVNYCNFNIVPTKPAVTSDIPYLFVNTINSVLWRSHISNVFDCFSSAIWQFACVINLNLFREK